MKALFSIIITLALASLILVGSSGTFVSFEASREVKVQVVPHENEYLGFDCEDGYAAVVEVGPHSETDFDALTVRNYLNEMKNVWIRLDPDYSGLPGNVDMFIETEDGTERMIASEDEYTFAGHVSVSDVVPGEYVIPVTMYARWNGGDAVIETCSIKLIVRGGPTIEKILLHGNTSDIPLKTYQEWVFQILVTNPTGEDLTLTITDTIPAEFNVSLGRTSASAGTYRFWAANEGHQCGGHCGGGHAQPATKMEWNVTIPAGGSAHINVTIFTRINNGGQQEFTSCGEYPLNEGAEIKGYDIRSNGINVTVKCDGGNDCKLRVANRWISGPGCLKVNKPADYHTRIFVKNTGNEKDVTIVQYVGKYFTLENYVPSKGTVSTTNMPDGRTLVTWTLHLTPRETAKLNLYEHTDGISIHCNRKKVMLVSRPCVVGCGCKSCPKYVYVYKCGCHGTGENIVGVNEVNDIDGPGLESDTGMEACEG
ncbi:hypothetical protein [Thermococcus radiotolerans]|uniref:Uncharacterized protein n=1 Tax=Thermococcus radiotolerans TaxID=187880 RepID=A0A2Z2N052_9EURY|nr:hypothetical protein [Thermococcus radiotolerans]ASJ15435.1 hypothetical protein A3L10_09955 [Thermococcus radiotolerans]